MSIDPPSCFPPGKIHPDDLNYSSCGGSFAAYISAANQVPLLSENDERALVEKVRLHGDEAAAEKLTLSHLRLVVSVARRYARSGFPYDDLVQEGNIGLMKAVQRYVLTKGARLNTYALPWIKSEMQEYMIRNSRMMKIATTKAHRKIFFSLHKHKLSSRALTVKQIEEISVDMGVTPKDLAEMEQRLAGSEVSLETNDDDSVGSAPISFLSTIDTEPTARIERSSVDALHSDGVSRALDRLSDRERRVVESRWLNDDDVAKCTFADLGRELNISGERVRQLELGAISKMRQFLSPFV